MHGRIRSYFEKIYHRRVYLTQKIIVAFLNLTKRWKQVIDEKKDIGFVKDIYRCNNLPHQRLSFQIEGI